MVNPENIVNKILKEKTYICDKCKRVFKEELRPVTLKTGKTIYACPQCLKIIARNGK